MSAFEFFFILYGLVLGLSVVEVVSGFARLAHDRRGVKVGWLTPLLAILMLLDLASFWVSAYGRLQDYELTYSVLVIALTISALYYVAARAWLPLMFVIPAVAVMVVKDKRILLALLVLMILPYGWNVATSLPR
ncbi:hypothetical protein [Brevundimonas sp.]